MQIIPAIDIKDGHCVRLKQGDMQSVTVFSEDPAAMAQHWLEQGAKRLHLVDLNGAMAGKPRNELAIREVVSVIGEEIPVQLGGGIRDLDTIERYLDDGITYVIIGTAAVKNPGFLHDACYAFPGHIIVGLEPLADRFAQYRGSKRSKGFSTLYLGVEKLLHIRSPRVAYDASVSKRSWAPFHPALEPSHHGARGNLSRGELAQLGVVFNFHETKGGAAGTRNGVGKRVRYCLVVELRAKIRSVQRRWASVLE